MKIIIVLIISLLSLVSCSSNLTSRASLNTPPVLSKAVNNKALVGVSSIAILPLAYDEHTRALFTDKFAFFHELAKAAEEELDLKLVSDVKRLVPYTSQSEPARVAAALNVDAVLKLTLSQYDERIGTRIAASRPARVDFMIELFDAKGTRIWEGSYHRQDEALTDNLLHVKEHFKGGMPTGWRTAHEMLIDGLRMTLREFSSVRRAQFVSGQ